MLKGCASLLIGYECPVGNYGTMLTNIELRFHKCDGHGSRTPTAAAWTLSPVAALALTVSPSASSLESEAT